MENKKITLDTKQKLREINKLLNEKFFSGLLRSITMMYTFLLFFTSLLIFSYLDGTVKSFFIDLLFSIIILIFLIGMIAIYNKFIFDKEEELNDLIFKVEKNNDKTFKEIRRQLRKEGN